MGKIIAITNNKGGVGKTTTTLNLGAGLAKAGYKTLLIDLDPQANLSSAFGLDDLSDNNVGNFLLRAKAWKEVVYSSELLDIAPAARQMENLEKALITENAREKILKKALEREKIREIYDFILIDCGPNLGTLTCNALCAADEFIIPFQSEFFSYKGTATIMQFTAKFVEDPDLNPNLKFGGVVLTQFHENTKGKTVKEIANGIRQSDISDKVFRTYIRRNIKLMESPMYKQNIFDYAQESNGASDYFNLTREFIERQVEV